MVKKYQFQSIYLTNCIFLRNSKTVEQYFAGKEKIHIIAIPSYMDHCYIPASIEFQILGVV
jgi:hypothetical protein